MPRRPSPRSPPSTIPTTKSSRSTTARATAPPRFSTACRSACRSFAWSTWPRNQGKSTALNVGALSPRAASSWCASTATPCSTARATWFVRALPVRRDARRAHRQSAHPQPRDAAGAAAGRRVLRIVGLIKRAQTVYGCLFTVSGVICAFRKRALHEAGWWSPHALTDDVDVSWRIQIAGWHIAYEPKALCWILMPETLAGCGASACAGPKAARRPSSASRAPCSRATRGTWCRSG